MEKLPIPRVRTVLKVKQSTTWPNPPISYVTSSNNVLFCFLKKADRFFDISESEPLASNLVVALQASELPKQSEGRERNRFLFQVYSASSIMLGSSHTAFHLILQPPFSPFAPFYR